MKRHPRSVLSHRKRRTFSTLIVALIGVFFLLTLCIVPSAYAKRVFSEVLIEKWGYKTTAIAGQFQEIRSLKNYGDSHEAFYARFKLNTSSFASDAEAAAEMQNIEKKRATAVGRSKDYGRILQKGKVLYCVTATSNYAHLEHQSLLMDQMRKHLETLEP